MAKVSIVEGSTVFGAELSVVLLLRQYDNFR